MGPNPFLTVMGAVALLFSGLAIDATFAQSNPFLPSQPDYPKWSAFTGVRWKDDRPLVEIGGDWYELLQFHGIPVDEIRKACEKNRWPYRHRFTEDLVQIVRLMGHEIDETADLELRDESGKTVTLKNVAMTEAKLRRTMRSAIRDATLSREDALLDLRAFQEALESQFSYLTANNDRYARTPGSPAGPSATINCPAVIARRSSGRPRNCLRVHFSYTIGHSRLQDFVS